MPQKGLPIKIPKDWKVSIAHTPTKSIRVALSRALRPWSNQNVSQVPDDVLLCKKKKSAGTVQSTLPLVLYKVLMHTLKVYQACFIRMIRPCGTTTKSRNYSLFTRMIWRYGYTPFHTNKRKENEKEKARSIWYDKRVRSTQRYPQLTRSSGG